MADLTVTITEAVTLNSSNRGSTNSITTTGIVDCFERIVTCTQAQVTTVAVFNSTPYGADGALDVDRAKYIRITNLDANGWIEVGIVTTASNYQVTVRAGGSHMLFQAEEGIFGDDDASPLFPTLQDIVTVEVKPSGSEDVQVEVFAGLV